MYSFRSGTMFINNYMAGETILAGTPVSVGVATSISGITDGTPVLLKTGNSLLPMGILTTDVVKGQFVGFQHSGFCGTSMIAATSQAPIVVGDKLMVYGGKLIKHDGNSAKAVAGTAMSGVVADHSAMDKPGVATKLFTDSVLYALPEIEISRATETSIS